MTRLIPLLLALAGCAEPLSCVSSLTAYHGRFASLEATPAAADADLDDALLYALEDKRCPG